MTRALTLTLAALLLLACAPDERDRAASSGGADASEDPLSDPLLHPGAEVEGVGPDCAAPPGCEQDRECAWCPVDGYTSSGLRRVEGGECAWLVEYTTASDGAAEWWDWCELLRNPPP